MLDAGFLLTSSIQYPASLLENLCKPFGKTCATARECY